MQFSPLPFVLLPFLLPRLLLLARHHHHLAAFMQMVNQSGWLLCGCLRAALDKPRRHQLPGEAGFQELTRKLGETTGSLGSILNWRMWWEGKRLQPGSEGGQRQRGKNRPGGFWDSPLVSWVLRLYWSSRNTCCWGRGGCPRRQGMRWV